MPAEITFTDSSAAGQAAVGAAADLFLRAFGNEIAARFQENVHVWTGAMQASAAVVMAGASDYADVVAAAHELNPQAEFGDEAVVGPHEVAVQVPINYAGIEEFGSINRPGHPAFTPAVESAIADADQIASEVFRA